MTISVPGVALVKRLSRLVVSISRTPVIVGGPDEFFLQPNCMRPAMMMRGINNFFNISKIFLFGSMLIFHFAEVEGHCWLRQARRHQEIGFRVREVRLG